ncbi:MAG: hypothetical protein KF832_31525 [Caldilineaceae bacterium]|nr:hypothetical protein [Caldilineaceae bacterium]
MPEAQFKFFIGCKDSRLQQLEVKAPNIQKELYTPTGAVLLSQVAHSGHKEFVSPDCLVAYIEVAYGIDRPLKTIIDDYSNNLMQVGWEPSLLYTPNISSEYIFFSKGAQIELTLYSFSDPLRALSTTINAEAEQYEAIYVIGLTYSEPSSLACSV